MFHFPTHPLPPIHSKAGNQAQPWLGFPIQKPSDHSSLANSPRNIAGHNVFHQQHVPRHPPNALKTHKNVSRKQNTHKTTCKNKPKDARVHYTQPNHHTNTTQNPNKNARTLRERHGCYPIPRQHANPKCVPLKPPQNTRQETIPCPRGDSYSLERR